MDIQKLFLSRWLYYSTIAVVLLGLFFYYLPSAREGNDMAANFVSEIWGLFFTLGIFIVILEFREWLEWKSVEDRVKKRIGRQIRMLFAELSIFCEVERVHFDPHSKEKRIKLIEKQLNTLASEKIRFTKEANEDLLKKDLRLRYERLLDSKRNNLGRIEERYSKFLGSEVRASLMDIQEYLDGLSLELRVRHIKNTVFFESISNLVGKIMKEILKLKRKGIWEDW